MSEDIKIWAIDGAPNNVERIPATDRIRNEGFLEDVLVRNPDMLMPGLTLVGRQTPIDGGYLDLLGIDENGTLVVFELKRGKLTREAVAQAIDYCSDLESLGEADLATHVAERSGNAGIDKIDDFEAWYAEQYDQKELTDLRPSRMVLVGLGADARAQRMVEFLARSGVDISLLTFHAYQHGDRTLLARQMESGEDRSVGTKSRRQRDAERRHKHTELAEKLGIGDLWQDAIEGLSVVSNGTATESGVTFYLRKITLDDVKHGTSHSVILDKETRRVRITFFPASIHLCSDVFEKIKERVQFEAEKPRNVRSTNKVTEQLYCVLDQNDWNAQKETLTALARTITDAWEKKRDEARRQRKQTGAL